MLKKVAGVIIGVATTGGASLFADTTDPTARAVAQVQGITATAGISYAGAAALGGGILLVGVLVYTLRKGIKLR